MSNSPKSQFLLPQLFSFGKPLNTCDRVRGVKNSIGYPIIGLDRPLRIQEVVAPRISRQLAHSCASPTCLETVGPIHTGHLYPPGDLDGPTGLQELEAPRIYRQLAYKGGKAVSYTHWPSLSCRR
jgi:hypothetical protein